MKPIRILTRSSKLALVQTHAVAHALQEQGLKTTIIEMVADGDEQNIGAATGTPLGKEAFVGTLQKALLNRQGDLAVHSLKDLPNTRVAGLTLAATPVRAAVPDVLILPSRHKPSTIKDSNHTYTVNAANSVQDPQMALESIPNRAIIGTSSLRRVALIKKYNPSLIVKPIRGNIDTRLKKLDSGEFDAIILAQAGLNRLNLPRRYLSLDPQKWIPAAGQGAIGIETADDISKALSQALQTINDQTTAVSVGLERALGRALGVDCNAPFGALATREGTTINLNAFHAKNDGSQYRAMSTQMPFADAEKQSHTVILDIAKSLSHK